MSFWKRNWGKDKICAITMTRLRPGKNMLGVTYTVRLKCGHQYYRKALTEWLKNNNSCPICRETIIKKF